MTELVYLDRRIGFSWVKCYTDANNFAVVCDVYVDGKLLTDVRYGNSHIPPRQQEKLGAERAGIPLKEFRQMLAKTRPPEDAMPTGMF